MAGHARRWAAIGTPNAGGTIPRPAAQRGQGVVRGGGVREMFLKSAAVRSITPPLYVQLRRTGRLRHPGVDARLAARTARLQHRRRFSPAGVNGPRPYWSIICRSSPPSMTSFSISRCATASRRPAAPQHLAHLVRGVVDDLVDLHVDLAGRPLAVVARRRRRAPLRNSGPARPWKLTRPSRLMPNSLTMLGRSGWPAPGRSSPRWRSRERPIPPPACRPGPP